MEAYDWTVNQLTSPRRNIMLQKNIKEKILCTVEKSYI